MADPVPPAEDLDALLARIASRANALRVDATGEGAEAERALLADLTRVVAMLRAGATAIGESLARVLEPGPPGAEDEGEQP